MADKEVLYQGVAYNDDGEILYDEWIWATTDDGAKMIVASELGDQYNEEVTVVVKRFQ